MYNVDTGVNDEETAFTMYCPYCGHEAADNDIEGCFLKVDIKSTEATKKLEEAQKYPSSELDPLETLLNILARELTESNNLC